MHLKLLHLLSLAAILSLNDKVAYSCLAFVIKKSHHSLCCSSTSLLSSESSRVSPNNVGLVKHSLLAVITNNMMSTRTSTGLNVGSNQEINTKPSISSYEEAISIIDKCSTSSTPSDNLYNAVRFIDRNACKPSSSQSCIYPTITSKETMWQKAFGSWKLVLATGGGKFQTFKPIPIFAFAYINSTSFGNGIGLNEDFILLSLLGPHFFDANKRQMKICIDDMFLGSRNVTNIAPEFVTRGIGMKKRPVDYSGKKGDRIPAFTIIASSDCSLVARGGSGGIAIWTKLEKDIQPAAYDLSNNRNI